MCSNLISRFGRFLAAALACAPAALALVLIFAPGAVHGQNLDANFLLKFGTPGNAVGQFNDPRAVAVNPILGKIVVADTLNNRTQVFDSAAAAPFYSEYPTRRRDSPRGRRATSWAISSSQTRRTAASKYSIALAILSRCLVLSVVPTDSSCFRWE